MDSTAFDYGIIGRGAAGLQLAMAMFADPFFINKKILIIDRADKNINDKRWCYWEEGTGQWDALISHQWEIGEFYSHDKTIPLNLLPYRYKMLKSEDYYRHAASHLQSHPSFTWVDDEVVDVTESDSGVRIKTANTNYEVNLCFDSRIHPDFYQSQDKYIRVLQHFKGYFIEFDKPVFDPSSMVLMDFRAGEKDQTSFMYVLPTSQNRALVEYTLFTDSLLEDHHYESNLKAFISRYISEQPYTILEQEQGIIPMSNFPFHHYSTDRIVKIGTAGSWVRPSTGYSFKNTEHYVRLVIENIKAGRKPQDNLFIKKYQYFDTLMLDVLKYENSAGPRLFEEMYAHNKIQRIFRFLDGKTSWWEDLSIIWSFSPRPFIKALFRRLF